MKASDTFRYGLLIEVDDLLNKVRGISVCDIALASKSMIEAQVMTIKRMANDMLVIIERLENELNT